MIFASIIFHPILLILSIDIQQRSSQILKQAFVIKSISGLLSGDGKDTFVPVPIFACNDCGHVNSVFVKDLKIKTKEPVSQIQL